MAKRTGRASVVAFTGEQTIRTIAAAAKELGTRLAERQTVTVDCRGVEETDLTFVQMLLAARKTARSSGKVLRLTAPAQGPVLACLHAAGLLPAVGAGHGGAGHGGAREFWMCEGDK